MWCEGIKSKMCLETNHMHYSWYGRVVWYGTVPDGCMYVVLGPPELPKYLHGELSQCSGLTQYTLYTIQLY